MKYHTVLDSFLYYLFELIKMLSALFGTSPNKTSPDFINDPTKIILFVMQELNCRSAPDTATSPQQNNKGILKNSQQYYSKYCEAQQQNDTIPLFSQDILELGCPQKSREGSHQHPSSHEQECGFRTDPNETTFACFFSSPQLAPLYIKIQSKQFKSKAKSLYWKEDRQTEERETLHNNIDQN